MKITKAQAKTDSLPPEWRARPVITRAVVSAWIKEQIPLVDCFFVAVSIHVIIVPLVWIAGWALPWPKPPVITTVVEYDLRGWPSVAKPKKVFELVDPELNKSH